MVYGEIGRYPLHIEIKNRIIMFWHKLVSCNNLSSMIYRLMFKLQENGIMQFKWLSNVKSIFSETGLNYVWDYHQTCTLSRDYLKQIVKQRLQDQYIQKWFNDIDISSRGQTYSVFKSNFGLEKYLLRLKPKNRQFILKFRTSNMHLPIETGRWIGLPRYDRTCNLCSQKIGDEYHYLFKCENVLVKDIRERYIPNYYYKYPSHVKMQGLFAICNVKIISNVGIFLEKLEKLLIL